MQESEKQEMRIKIVKDVLSQLNQIEVMSGVYLTFSQIVPENQSLQKILLEEQPHCEACALGSMFLSHVRLNNEFNTNEFSDGRYSVEGTKIYEVLTQYFDRPQLQEIESAFEGITGHQRLYYGFKYEIPDDKKRLRIILENILQNDGEFIPQQLIFDECDE